MIKFGFTQVVQLVYSGPTKHKGAYPIGDLNDGALVGVWLFERSSRTRLAGVEAASGQHTRCGCRNSLFVWFCCSSRGSQPLPHRCFMDYELDRVQPVAAPV